ncbi:polysaccharide export protein [Qipengyuania sp. S6317L1]|uniref:polysaccharide biosynthesis/export family protein n=1 Tax=Qipengyuania sp. S6317L1 TaxID=2926410 RepID=UPI001FF5170D|nr:polysaccharide biosynthesis/export family protein [Qipengyuania sp. S6317L1]MCK0098408.1 polysaccharide export protein [Qipengyuania sp. S6317L1]
MNRKANMADVNPSRLSAFQAVALGLVALTIAGCSSLGASGPAGGDVRSADSADYQGEGIEIVDLDGRAIERLGQYGRASEFAEVFTDEAPSAELIGYGDVLDIAIWEAPPAVLFGTTSTGADLSAMPETARSAPIPQQMVGEAGTVSVPFVGPIKVVGRKVDEVERAIVSSLRGRAHDPQAIVRLIRNETRTVTVLGDVAQSKRMALSARGERLLDAVASAGGTRNPVDRSIVQITRASNVVSMPLARVIEDPAQNVQLFPDDVVTVLHQPFSFVALGSVRGSAEVPFDGAGLSLAEALGRVGGLNDARADVRGVFIFRLEDREALGAGLGENVRTTADGRVPVIYRLDMSDPASLFAMQDFAVRDDDVLYVSTAPGADLQRFVSTISSAAFSVIGITNALSTNNN